MLTKCEFHPVTGMVSTTVIQFDIGDTPVGSMLPVTDLEFEYQRSNNRRSRQEQVGQWNGYVKPEEILVHMSFDILGLDTTDFNTKKRNIRNATSYATPITSPLTIGPLGTLVLNFDGYPEDIQAPVSIDGDISVPYSGPAYSRCQVTWVVAQGYFTGSGTSAIYYPS